MSHFTDNLHLRREIQRLLNENNQMKALLSEYRGPYDTGENIGGFDFRTPEEKAEQEELERKRNEAAKKITTDELQRMMDRVGFTGTPEEFQKKIRKERFDIKRKAKDEAAAGARSAEDFQKAIESGQYKLSAGQQKRYEKEGSRFLEKLSRGLSRREAERLRIGAKVTDQKDLDRLKATKDVPFLGSRSDAQRIIRSRENVQGAEDYVSSEEKLTKIAKAAGDRFRAGQDETIRRNREEALRTSTGQKVRDFNALVSGQQAEIKQFGQQMSKLSPEYQEVTQAGMRRGLSPGQAAERALKIKQMFLGLQELGVGKLKSSTDREADSRQRLSDMEAAYRAKYPGRDMSDQALQGRIPPMPGGRVLSAAERRKQLEAMSDEELKRKQQLGVGQLKTATAREAASRQTLNSMETAARAKREQSATQAIQDILGRFQ